MRLYIVLLMTISIVPLSIICLNENNKEKTNESIKQSKHQEQQSSDMVVESKMDNAALFSQQLNNDRLISSLIKSILRITSNGFKSGLEASVRGLFDKPFSGAVAAISMVIGAVAILAFYESPISPLPVPPLPDPPVGRFPPEHPIWPPPNRGKQQKQQQSYQPKRSSMQQSPPPLLYYPANNFMLPAIGMNNNYNHNYPIQRSDPDMMMAANEKILRPSMQQVHNNYNRFHQISPHPMMYKPHPQSLHIQPKHPQLQQQQQYQPLHLKKQQQQLQQQLGTNQIISNQLNLDQQNESKNNEIIDEMKQNDGNIDHNDNHTNQTAIAA